MRVARLSLAERYWIMSDDKLREAGMAILAEISRRRLVLVTDKMDCGIPYNNEMLADILGKAALADSADAPPEVTEEMVEAALAESVCTVVLHPRLSGEELQIAVRKLLQAALAAAQKEGS